MNKKLSLLIIFLSVLLISLSSVSALCKGVDGYYHDCDDVYGSYYSETYKSYYEQDYYVKYKKSYKYYYDDNDDYYKKIVIKEKYYYPYYKKIYYFDGYYADKHPYIKNLERDYGSKYYYPDNYIGNRYYHNGKVYSIIDY